MGLIINYSVARPNYYDNTMNEFAKIRSLCKESLKNIAIGNKDLKIDYIENNIKISEAFYSKLIDELNYSKGSFNLDIIDKSLDLCRQIYFHMKSIELLEKELFLTKDNYKKLKRIYKNETILDIIDKSLDLCRQIYFHMKSIELLEKELFLTKDNYKKLKRIYKNETILLKVNESDSPVFNFHLSKVIEKTKLLEELIGLDN